MLASLLPGLRDVRTPLTIGYLWLTFAWIVWGDHLPDGRPSGNGPIARLYDLSDFLGNGAVIAAISFSAYVLGAVSDLIEDVDRVRHLGMAIMGSLVRHRQ
jgi:hypothetical protein